MFCFCIKIATCLKAQKCLLLFIEVCENSYIVNSEQLHRCGNAQLTIKYTYFNGFIVWTAESML